MSPLIERLLFEFTRQAPKADLGDECFAAEEAILKFRDTGEGSPELIPELENTEIAESDVAALRTALKAFVEAFPAHPSTGSALWALSKLDDETLSSFYVDQIRLHHSERRVDPVQQAAYALLRLG